MTAARDSPEIFQTPPAAQSERRLIAAGNRSSLPMGTDILAQRAKNLDIGGFSAIIGEKTETKQSPPRGSRNA
jgi:hypothetical protein